MNTLELNFATWFNEQGYVWDEPHKTVAMQAAFNAGYISGFNHAKKEAIRAMEQSLQKPATP